MFVCGLCLKSSHDVFYILWLNRIEVLDICVILELVERELLSIELGLVALLDVRINLCGTVVLSHDPVVDVEECNLSLCSCC